VHSQLEIAAEYRSGRTVVHSIRAGFHFAARETGPGVVHLVGTAAGPLGGDDVTIAVSLGPGARLSVRSAGATIVQPGAESAGSRLRLLLTVADGAELDVATEPTVICHGAEHDAHTLIDLTGSGQVRLLEQVLLGRSNEPGGRWLGRTWLTRDGVPELRHTLRSAVIAADGSRVISTLLRSGLAAVPATSGAAVAMPLAAGGLLVTASGTALIPTQQNLLAAAALAGVPQPQSQSQSEAQAQAAM
jgi:urease accessory protein